MNSTIKGILYILTSALAFAASTVFAKLINNQSSIPGIEITFFRFSTGFFLVLTWMLLRKESFRPVRFRYVFLRGLFNTVAVIFFFMGIERTTVTNANMLNMTYPVFVFMMAPFLNGERNTPANYLYLALTMAGVYLIVVPDFKAVNPGDIFALLSGITAGGAISTLREARKYDSSSVILLYLMGMGTLINLFIVLPVFIMPGDLMAFYMVLHVACALLGQLTLTVGYRHVEASTGSLVSSSRILFAGMMGVIFFADPLTEKVLAGGALIVLSLTGVSGILNRFFGRRERVEEPPS